MPWDPNELNEGYEIEPEIEDEGSDRALDAWREMTNIVPEIDDELLVKLGQKVIDNHDIDLQSRSQWESRVEEIQRAARLEPKERIWAGVPERNNIPDESIITAALRFQAQALPVIIPGKDVVKCEVVGRDYDGRKKQRADRIAEHMSDQLLNRVPHWQEETDRLLLILGIVGFAARKTYYCSASGAVKSELLTYHDVVVNNNARNFREARCVTHVIRLSKNEVVSRKRAGIFEIDDVDLMFSSADDECNPSVDPEEADKTFYEQHLWYDLDEDGYAEPLIVTVERSTAKVVRICARWDEDGVTYNEMNEIVDIEPTSYFTRFIMFHSPCGSFYGMGLGHLLYPINCTRTTVLNQILDAGFSNNKPGGFLGRGIQLGRGSDILKIQPGVYRSINAKGDDIRKDFVTIPTSPPDATLYKLWLDLKKESEEIASTQMMGELPPANTPATTTLAYLDESMKTFKSVFIRIFLSLKQEFSKIRRLNYLYLPVEEYNRVLDLPPEALKEIQNDYNADDLDVQPVADLRALVRVYKIFLAEALLQLREQGLNDAEISRRYLEAIDTPDIEPLLQPQENPAEQAAQQAAMEKEQAEAQLKLAQRDAELARAERDAAETELAKARARLADAQVVNVQVEGPQKRKLERAKVAQQIARNVPPPATGSQIVNLGRREPV